MNICIIGINGQVATGLLNLICERNEFGDDINIFGIDISGISNSYIGNVKKVYVDSYHYCLKKVIQEHHIECVVHLVPTSSLVIWNICREIDWEILYIDASVYLSVYSSKLDSVKDLLYSNFKYFDRVKSSIPSNVKGISSTGFNPGIVNFLVYKYCKQYGTNKLKGIYTIENDAHIPVSPEENKLYVTWGKEACPDECTEYATFFKSGKPYILDISACDLELDFSIKGESHKGYAVIHEECYSFAKKYKDAEVAFLYSLPESVRNGIQKYKVNDIKENDLVVISPVNMEIEGSNTLGIKLVYEDKEIDIVNTHEGNQHVSGTIYQVSAGVYCALYGLIKSRGSISGVNWIDDVFYNTGFSNDFEMVLNDILDFEEYSYKFPNMKSIYNTVAENGVGCSNRLIFFSKNEYSSPFIRDIEKEVINRSLSTNFSIDNFAHVYAINKATLECITNDNIIPSNIYNIVDDFVKAYNQKYDSIMRSLNCTLGDVERYLLGEGKLPSNIRNFIIENYDSIITNAKLDNLLCTNMWEYIIMLYEYRGGYNDPMS